jgi:hypothetical protein
MTKQSLCIDMIKKQIPKFQFSGHCFPILPSATVKCQCSDIFYNLFLWNKFIMYNSTSVNKPMSMLSAYEQTYLSSGHGSWWALPLRCLLLGFWVTPIQLSHHLWSPYNRILGFNLSWRSWYALTQFTHAPHSAGRAQVCWQSDAHTDCLLKSSELMQVILPTHSKLLLLLMTSFFIWH